jgi:hypothetical protein
MIVELATRSAPIDMVLFADPGAEKQATYAFIPVFREGSSLCTALPFTSSNGSMAVPRKWLVLLFRRTLH